MDIIKTFSTKGETEGKWFDIGDASFLIAKMDNPQYEKLRNKLIKPHVGKFRSPNMEDSSLLEEIMDECILKTILLDWKNITETIDGEVIEIPYSLEKARQYLKISEFKNQVMTFAGNWKNFKAYEDEEAEKN
jgi:hypothetical protein